MAAYNQNKLGELRPSQIITTFGPGSIVDGVKDSVTILDISYWKHRGQKIVDGRLASYLRVDCFYMPRSGNEDIPVVSFPRWHVCSKCGRLFDIRQTFNLDTYLKCGPTCPDCQKPYPAQAYPARFIIICEDGHMSDFPWRWWVHEGDSSCRGDLRMYSPGNTSTLDDIRVFCTCGKSRTLAGATQRENFNGYTCPGHHPFRPKQKDQKCGKPVVPSQRGASNVYFAVYKSAISIPPWINPLYTLIDEHLREIRSFKEFYGDEGVKNIYEKYFSQRYSKAEFDDALARRMSNIKEFTEIKVMEYQAITHHDDPAYAPSKKHFKAEEDALPEDLRKYFNRLIRISRLRLVNVLLGFTRADAPDPDADADAQPNVVRLSKDRQESWLPANEVNGEGIFIEFNKSTIAGWSDIEPVKALSHKYSQSYLELCESKGWTIKYDRGAVYVLIHTFAHLLIKQMSMSSGYSSSAIRERIYFGDNMCGLLLYTGSSDKEGSLGGLVELGNVSSVKSLMRDAFQEALICTNDPECMNNIPSGKKTNGAACHSCCMISETACENGNRLLDRGLVVPLPGREECSYFRELVNELCEVEI